MNNKKHEAWGLFSQDGTFIAALRFRPKRFYSKFRNIKGGYYYWTDCHGSKFDDHQKFIEGSMNARLKKVSIGEL